VSGVQVVTPGPQILNDSPGGNYKLWVPNDFPACATNAGRYYSTRTESPIRWVLRSLGPRPDSDKTQDAHAPIANRSWYRRAGDSGIIARMATKDEMQLKTP
jgi:hypothetical protein